MSWKKMPTEIRCSGSEYNCVSLKFCITCCEWYITEGRVSIEPIVQSKTSYHINIYKVNSCLENPQPWLELFISAVQRKWPASWIFKNEFAKHYSSNLLIRRFFSVGILNLLIDRSFHNVTNLRLTSLIIKITISLLMIGLKMS